MPIVLLHKFDNFLSKLLLFIILGGAMILHTLTALAIKSYYGDPWGYVAFLLPFGAEAYLIFIQLGDNMYNYTILLSLFICIASLVALLWLLKSIIMTKVNSSIKVESN